MEHFAELVVASDKIDGRIYLRIAGELDLHSSHALHAYVEDLSPFDMPVTVDLAQVGFIDSTGIRGLLELNSQVMESMGVPLTVANSSDMSRRLFALTGIDQVLNIVD
jgi:anti-anti-sigma factor